jgi:putative FmdB family regulatory protein
MPIYEYACTSCGRSVEVVHGVHVPGPEVCEVCGGRMRKLVSTPSIHFKGSGWAKKDARDGARQRSGASGREQAREGAAASGGGEKAGAGGEAGGPEPGQRSKAAGDSDSASASKRTGDGLGPKAGASD